MIFQGKVASASAGSRFQFDFPVYRGVLTDIFSLFPGPNFTIVIIPAQVAWSI